MPLVYPANSGFLCSVSKFLKSSPVTQDDEPVIMPEVCSELCPAHMWGEQLWCSAEGLHHPKPPLLSREGGSASGRLHSTGSSVFFLWATGRRCVLDAPATPAMQEGFSSWCWLILDHILARKLCSASVSTQRIPKAQGFYHSLHNCREVSWSDIQQV